MLLTKIFKEAVKVKASDVHILTGKPPVLRVDGELKIIKNIPVLDKKQAEKLIFEILSPTQKEKLLKNKELDLSYQSDDRTRFRVNCFFEKNNLGMVARIIPFEIPSMNDIEMPEVVYELTRKKQGLILVTGPTGCGKSTSMAAMIDLINKEQSVNIVTLEDPIEFVFSLKKSLIKQREIGFDTLSFSQGLRYILRQDPNVIMVGEMRDLETISTTLTLAETGHLVLATLHTNSSTQTIDRIIDVFPSHQQHQIRTQLSMVLNGVIAQQLLPKINGGRTAVREIMINTPAVSNLIRENKISQIQSIIQTSADKQMITFDRALEKNVKEKIISKEVAEIYSVGKKI